jgi:hypothetical protein
MPVKKLHALFVLLALFALTDISAAKAVTYTAANVKGSYSFLMTKWQVAGGSQGAILGILSFDGVGVVSGSMNLIDDGKLQTFSLGSGTYTVSTNGSGSMVFGVGTQSLQIGFVLTSVSASVAHTLQLLIIPNTADETNTTAGTANLMSLTGPATASKLKGTYSLILDWWTQQDSQQTLLGTITFDGKSKAMLSFTQQLGSSTSTGTGSGTYTVNSDGSGTISLTLSNSTTMQFDFVMNTVSGAVAKGLQLLDVTDPNFNSTDAGTAIFQ